MQEVLIRIDPQVITNSVDLTGGEILPDTSWTKHYEIWAHANGLLKPSSASEQDCAVALFQLNRAVDFRDKVLAEIYPFKHIPGIPRGFNQHQVMHDLGLILPIMKGRLDSVRNRLMHQPDTKPPDLAICRDLLEFTWYYLRSTDRLCAQTESEFDMEYSATGSKDYTSWLSWQVIRKPWTVLVSGWLPEALVRDNDNPDKSDFTSRSRSRPRFGVIKHRI